MPLESLLGALWRLPTVGQAIVGIWVKFASAPTPNEHVWKKKPTGDPVGFLIWWWACNPRQT
jgi:hypothetical protein